MERERDLTKLIEAAEAAAAKLPSATEAAAASSQADQAVRHLRNCAEQLATVGASLCR